MSLIYGHGKVKRHPANKTVGTHCKRSNDAFNENTNI